MKKKTGMTLAETLITLTIIGVVISIVFPIIINSSNDAKYKALLKKQYSSLSQATIYAANKNDGTLKGIPLFHIPLLQLMLPSLNTIQVCSDWQSFSDGHYPGCPSCSPPIPESWHTVPNPCFKSATFKGLNGSNLTLGWPDQAGAILSDGSTILLCHQSVNCTSNGVGNEPDSLGLGAIYNTATTCGTILLDVNGYAEPNRMGKDIYEFWILKDKLVPYGTNDNMTNTCNTASTGIGCAAEYLKNN
ncbi:MAG: type II secretion system protein [bacterium]